jgi:RNA polymerase primary sigma factor
MRDFKVTERYTPRAGRALQKYLSEVEKCKVLDIEQETDLVNKFKSGDAVAREKIIKANLRFVISVAKSYTQDPDLFSELIAVGNIGLVEALEKFDSSRGFKFVSYAVWHIRKEMLLFLYESTRTVRIPSNRVQQLKAIKDAQSKLIVTEGRDIPMEEAIEYLKKSGDEKFKNLDSLNIESFLTADIKPHSLSASLSSDDDSTTWNDVIADQSESPEDFVLKSSGSEFLRELIHILSPLEQEIVIRYHGLNGEILDETFDSISEKIGMSPQSAQQKYVKALKKLKIYARRNSIKREDFTSN